jgi:hypothetical protein
VDLLDGRFKQVKAHDLISLVHFDLLLQPWLNVQRTCPVPRHHFDLSFMLLILQQRERAERSIGGISENNSTVSKQFQRTAVLAGDS